jgi:hypothetical protein
VEIRVGTFTLAAMDGVDTTGKEWREKLKPLAAVSSVIPAFQVSSRGEYLQTESFDRMFERMHKVGLLPPEQMENMRKALAMPLMKDVMQNVMAQYWATWVENWVDWPLSPGTERDAHVTRSMVLGTASTEADVHARFVGYRDGYAILEQTTTSTGDAVAGLVTSLVKDLRGTPSNAGLRFTAARVELRTSTETRPENLRPRRTRSEKEMYLKLSDGTEKREREIHDLTWDWDHATGCVNK